jgi:hypothetical protein
VGHAERRVDGNLLLQKLYAAVNLRVVDGQLAQEEVGLRQAGVEFERRL